MELTNGVRLLVQLPDFETVASTITVAIQLLNLELRIRKQCRYTHASANAERANRRC